MVTDHTVCARHMADGLPHIQKAPRAATSCRQPSLRRTVFAMTLVVLAGMLPAVVTASPSFDTSSQYIDTHLDTDGNGVEDVLDSWLAGHLDWNQLRRTASSGNGDKAANGFSRAEAPAQAVWDQGMVRILCLGSDPEGARLAEIAANRLGNCRTLHEIERFGGVRVMAVDEPALKSLLNSQVGGRLLLDRDGSPALDNSVRQMGARQLQSGPWQLGGDWSATVAILDSGCDSAHDDLGDFSSDNLDGPPPAVGDATDWYPGETGWPLFSGYRIVGWHDVTDDFPEAQGPWDYHHHGTALASVVAGSGRIQNDHRGVNPAGRLTVVKFYDFDQVWHTWAGDFLAACAWTLDNREALRIRVVLAAVNWTEDLGITDAMNELVAVGILPVVAMGNHGDDAGAGGYPALVADVLTVGSANDAGAVSAFSGRGAPGLGKPDLLAPGGGLLLEGGRIEAADNEPNDTYSGRQGTSLAAAHAAGAAFMMAEALVDNGMPWPEDAEAVRTQRALLKATSGFVGQMESADGSSLVSLSGPNLPDEIRGWGQLRADAAVSALLAPLFPGADQVDSLTADDHRTVIARRLEWKDGVRYLVEAVPDGELDVDLIIVDPRLLDFDPLGPRLPRRDASGPGVSEFLYHENEGCDWAFLVVRRISGEGEVTLRVHEADTFLQQGRRVDLPGVVTGAPNYGSLPLASGTAVVIPSLVDLDPQARSVNVLDGWGLEVAGWPVYVFPHSSSIGGLSQPLVWNLDGNVGDEIVLSSDFGSIYFFNHLGAYNEVNLDFNVPLTPPVGLEAVDGSPLVAVVDDHGELNIYSWGPVLETNRALGHENPVPLASGRLRASEPQRLVVAFEDGTITVLDSQGMDIPGWPRLVDGPVTLPPVLVDFDGDGDREIHLPVFNPVSGSLQLRSFQADGSSAPGDGTVLPAPNGGAWMHTSWPAVVGRFTSGDLRLEVLGLTNNQQTGPLARWNLARSGWLAAGYPLGESLTSFEVGATTNQGILQLDHVLMAPPLAWDYQEGPGSEVMLLAGLKWQEILYGHSSIAGSTLGWFFPDETGRVLEARGALSAGGSDETLATSVAAALVPIADDVFYQIQVVEQTAHFTPLRAAHQIGPFWPLARADQLNTGSYPVGDVLTATPGAGARATEMIVYPNPGPGRFHFQWKGETSNEGTRIDVYDLRGRLVARLAPAAAGGQITWDGRDLGGKLAAAGNYLAVARQGGHQSVTRVVLTR